MLLREYLSFLLDFRVVFVFQIPVYLSQALAKNLYIYQYPVRPGNRDWKDIKVVNAAIKPKNKLVRLEVGLDTHGDTYCPSKGEQIALNTDGLQVSVKQHKQQHCMCSKSVHVGHGPQVSVNCRNLLFKAGFDLLLIDDSQVKIQNCN